MAGAQITVTMAIYVHALWETDPFLQAAARRRTCKHAKNLSRAAKKMAWEKCQEANGWINGQDEAGKYTCCILLSIRLSRICFGVSPAEGNGFCPGKQPLESQ
jgi:hypothetical protein